MSLPPDDPFSPPPSPSVPPSVPPLVPPSVPPRDPLLDDPVFAELIAPAPGPAPGPGPVAGAGAPLIAEPVADPPASAFLPVAEVLPPVASGPPAPLPKPPTPMAPPVSSRPSRLAEPLKGIGRPSPASDAPGELPRPNWFAACGVLGCLGVAVLASIAVLAWIAITLFGQLGEKLSHRKKGPSEAAPQVLTIGPIAPTALPANAHLALPSRIDAVGRGGGGRFLFLRAFRINELLAFDANRGEVAHHFPLGEPNALFAAGKSKLFIYKPNARTLSRFDLATGNLEEELPRPPGVNLIDSLAIGPGSDGPLYLLSANPRRPSTVHVVDAATFRPIGQHTMAGWKGRSDRRVNAHASSDGRVLGVSSDRGASIIRFEEKGLVAIPLSTETGKLPAWAIPSPDGQAIYTPVGVYDNAGRFRLGSGRQPFFTLPSVHANGLFLSLSTENGQVEGFPHVHASGAESTLPILTFDVGELSGDLPDNELRDIATADRIHFWPEAGLLAVLPISNQELQLFKIDARKTLARAKKAFVAFATEPPATVRRGQLWSYVPRFYSRSNVLPKLSVQGPDRMKHVNGILSWQAPGNITGTVEVTITAEIVTRGLTRVHAVQKFQITIVE